MRKWVKVTRPPERSLDGRRIGRIETESIPANMGAQKRKRSDLKAEDVNGNEGTGATGRVYKTGKEVQSAIEFASKDCKQ